MRPETDGLGEARREESWIPTGPNWRAATVKAIRSPRHTWNLARGLARGLYYKIKFRLLGRRVSIGRYFHVVGKLDIRGPGTVIFGDFCSVHSTRLGPTTPYTHAPGAVIRFGDRVRLTSTRLGCFERIEVGDWSGLSDARIMDGDFHALEVFDRPRYQTGGTSRPVIIGRNVWVGAGSIVLKGVRIGDHSVVAAGSVVASNVPSCTVVFGNPARVIWRMRGPAAKAGNGSIPDPTSSAQGQG